MLIGLYVISPCARPAAVIQLPINYIAGYLGDDGAHSACRGLIAPVQIDFAGARFAGDRISAAHRYDADTYQKRKYAEINIDGSIHEFNRVLRRG